MTTALNIMSEDDLQQAPQLYDEPGFGSLSTSRGHLPLKAMQVQAKISGLISQVSLRQTFVNTLDEPMEATYVFPLPPGAAVTKFRMEVNGRIVDGVIKERGQARREYNQAIQKGQRAAITEEERPGTFTMRVGNIMPGEAPTVWLIMTGPLPYDEGEATFRFPLVVAPRYIPGNPLPGESVGDGVAFDTDATPDASRISPPVLLPGYPNPVRLSMSVWLDPEGLPLSQLRSSLHTIETREDEQGPRSIELQPGERLNRDFILRYRLGDEAVKTSLALTEDDARPGEGTFLMTLVPPVELSRSTKPRDVIFVLDRSGSMGGWKMVAARRAVARMIDTLRDKDRFSVMAFDNVVERPRGQGDALVEANNRNRYAAIEFLAGLEARGGTEMARPLRTAAEQLSGGYDDRERVLVLATDGQVGNEDQILRDLGARLKNVRIFTLGIDRAVNEGFLKKLADLGGGLSELVESEDRLDEVMDKMHRRIGTPVLTELSVVPSGLEVEKDSMVPKRLPDLFAGAPVFIMGRYRGAPEGSLTIRGKDAEGHAFERVLYARKTDNQAICSVWARAQVRALEDQFVLTRNRALEKQITETSIRYQVLCRFTAFLAIDQEVVNPGGEQHKVTQPVESPDGWSMLGAKDSLKRFSGKARKKGKRARPAGPPAPAAAKMDSFAQGADAPPPPPSAPAPADPAPQMMRKAVMEEVEDLDEGYAEGYEESGYDDDSYEPMELERSISVGSGNAGARSGGGGMPDSNVFGSIFERHEEQEERKRSEEQAVKEKSLQAEERPRITRPGQPVQPLRPVTPVQKVPQPSSLEQLKRTAESMVQRMNEEMAHPMSLSGRIATLSIISAQLETLVKSLRTVGTHADQLKLSALLNRVKALLSQSSPAEAEAKQTWNECLSVLREFSGGAARREDFWR